MRTPDQTAASSMELRLPGRQTTVRIDYEGFRRRLLEDCLQEATAFYWRKRADTLEAARRRPDDYTGRASVAELTARDERLRLAVLACRQKSALIEAGLI